MLRSFLIMIGSFGVVVDAADAPDANKDAPATTDAKRQRNVFLILLV